MSQQPKKDLGKVVEARQSAGLHNRVVRKEESMEQQTTNKAQWIVNPSAFVVKLGKELKPLYESGTTIRELQSSFDLSANQVYYALKAAGASMRKRGSTPNKEGISDEERLSVMKGMFDEGATLQEIGNRFDLSRERVRQILHSAGVKSGTQRSGRKPSPLTAREIEIVEAYNAGMRPSDLMEKYNLTYAQIHLARRRYSKYGDATPKKAKAAQG